MRAIKPLLIAGVAAAGLIGAAAVAASTPQPHMLLVRLPNGAVEQIRYFGNTPPKVVVSRAPIAMQMLGPVAMFGPNSPFAQMNQIQAQLDRQMAAMMAQAHAMQASAMTGAAGPAGLQQVTVGQAPAGAQSFSTISTFSGGHACSRSVEVLSRGAGNAPEVISKSSGDCGSAAVPGIGIIGPPSAAADAPHAIDVKAQPKPAHPNGTTI